MAPIKNPLELYKLLPQTNCGECRVPSCMAFAVALVQGNRKPRDCPYLEAEGMAEGGGEIVKRGPHREDQEEVIRDLRRQVAGLAFASIASRLGATLIGERLAVNCLGKDFLVARNGEMTSSCHCNVWVLLPILQYIVHCQGREPLGEWIPFGEVMGPVEGRYFAHRCEEPFRMLADAHTDLVLEILSVFGTKAPAGESSAEHSFLLLPLPKVPVLVNYWLPEEGFDSRLTLLFDRTAAANLPPEPLYFLCRGIVEMFRQLIVRHSRDGRLF